MTVKLPSDRTLLRAAANCASVFVVALIVRLWYCFLLAPRQVCGFNDETFFGLGSGLNEAIHSSSLLHHLGMPFGMQLFNSTTLLEQLANAGPVNPLYISFLYDCFKITTPDVRSIDCAGFVFANCIVGAVACAFIYLSARLAFNRTTALIAGLLAITYPAAIVNSMQCFPESLGYAFVSIFTFLSCFLLLRHRKQGPSIVACILLGVVSALLVLTVPDLSLMPVVIATLLVIYKVQTKVAPTVAQSVAATPTEPAKPEAPSDEAQIKSATEEPVSLADGGRIVEKLSSTILTKIGSEPTKQDVDTISFLPGDEVDETLEQKLEQENIQQAQEPSEQNSAEAEASEFLPGSASQAESAESAEQASNSPQSGKTLVPVASPESKERVGTEGSPLNVVPLVIQVACVILGLGLIFVPWFQLVRGCSDQFQLASVPLLSAQLWFGNLLPSDGWRMLPDNQLTFADSAVTVKNFLRSIAAAPLPFLALAMQKIPRLWAGGWNDYAVTVYGVTPFFANLWHCLLLFTAYLGVSLASLRHSSWRLSRTLPCVILFSSIFIYHCLFWLLTPVSRNAFTAMPAVILLSALCLTRVFSLTRLERLRPFCMLMAASVLFGWLLSGQTLVPFIMEFNTLADTAHFVDVSLTSCAWVSLLFISLPFIEREAGSKISSASDALKFGCFCAVVALICMSLKDLRWSEWMAELRSSRGAVKQTVSLPKLDSMPDLSRRAASIKDAFVLVDLESSACAPPVVASINGVACRLPARPWLELKATESDCLPPLQGQAHGMGRDWRTFRQWWVIPVPFSLLKFGQENEISVSLVQSQRRLSARIFGQYGAPRLQPNAGSWAIMPSPHAISWQKGFGTYEAGDMRLFEAVFMGSKITANAMVSGGEELPNDLSFEHGLQTGFYRMLLAVPTQIGYDLAPLPGAPPVAPKALPPASAAHDPNDSLLAFSRLEPITVEAAVKESQIVSGAAIALPQNMLPNQQIAFDCVMGASTDTDVDVSMEFTGTDEAGEHVDWTSPWQPECTSVGQEPNPFSVTVSPPDRILGLQNLAVSVRVIPRENGALLKFFRSSKAYKVVLEQISLRVLPPLDLPLEAERDWIIF